MLLPLLTGHIFPRFCLRHWAAPYKGKGGPGAQPSIDLDPPQSLGLQSFSKQMCKLSLAGTRSMQQLPGICLTNVLHSLTGCIGAYALAIKAEN